MKNKIWVSRVLGAMIRRKGVVVSDEQHYARMKICESCEFFGKVQPVMGVEFDSGCTLCTCPLDTKCRMKVIMRSIENLGTKLTLKEFITDEITKEHLVPEVVRCSNYKVEDFWEEIDAEYQ